MKRFAFATVALAGLLVSGCAAAIHDSERADLGARSNTTERADGTSPDVVGHDYAWFYKDDLDGPMAMFGPPQSEPVFTLACDMATLNSSDPELVLIRSVPLAGGETLGMQIKTTSATEGLVLNGIIDGMPGAEARLSVHGRAADQLAGAVDGFTMLTDGYPDVVMTADQSVAKVVETCRARAVFVAA